jgi:hypothetical protein
MASAVARAYMGPSGVQGWSSWLGGQGVSPLKLKAFELMKVKSSLKFASFAAGAVVLYIYLTCFTFINGTEECKAG